MCYDNEEIWGDRKEAIDFYLECMSFSDGAERERYSAILEQLMTGNTYCTNEYYWKKMTGGIYVKKESKY